MPDDSMCFLEPAISEEGALRTRRLPLTAGVDPLVVVAGPIAAIIRDALPGWGSEVAGDGPHAGGCTRTARRR